jgi:LysM repeat protein
MGLHARLLGRFPIAGRPPVSGDTIFGIATQYGLNWQALLTLNGLSENSVIQIGQQIKLK